MHVQSVLVNGQYRNFPLYNRELILIVDTTIFQAVTTQDFAKQLSTIAFCHG